VSDNSLVEFDRNLVNSVKFTLNSGQKGQQGGQGEQGFFSWLFGGEEASQQGGQQGGQGGYTVEFQFLPKIKSESNASRWKEEDIWGNDQLKIHQGSSSKKLTMEWEYVCTDSKWDAVKISTNCRNLKAYFYEFSDKVYPLAFITYGVVMKDMMCRVMSVDITYGDEVVDNGGVHPLHTKVAVGLEMAHNILNPNDKEGKGKLLTEPLQAVKFDWY
jgi:hypothetical protein